MMDEMGGIVKCGHNLETVFEKNSYIEEHFGEKFTYWRQF